MSYKERQIVEKVAFQDYVNFHPSQAFRCFPSTLFHLPLRTLHKVSTMYTKLVTITALALFGLEAVSAASTRGVGLEQTLDKRGNTRLGAACKHTVSYVTMTSVVMAAVVRCTAGRFRLVVLLATLR